MGLARAGTARGEQAARARVAGGMRVGCRRAGGRRASGRRAAAARGAYAAGERPGRWAHGLGARAGFGLCTRCTWPVFGPVRLGIFPESNFWTLFVNPVHEHCSSQNSLNFFIKLNEN